MNVLIKVLFCFRHIFLGFTKCGQYVLSYTSDYGEDDDFSFYIYHLYWWEFNLHSRLKQVKKANSHTVKDYMPHPMWYFNIFQNSDVWPFVLRLRIFFRSIMSDCLQERKSTAICTLLSVSGPTTAPRL